VLVPKISDLGHYIFTNFDPMIPMRSLAKGNEGKESISKLGLGISQDPTIGIASNLEGFYETQQHSRGKMIKSF